jgi:hypothetical protein
VVNNCVVLGGSGPWPVSVGDLAEFVFSNGHVYVQRSGSSERLVEAVVYEDLRAVEFSGRGVVTKGGGFIGGGFGIEGMLGGMALAGVLNSLTQSSSVETMIRLEYDDGELWVAHGTWTPDQLRILLSEVFMAMRQPSTRGAVASRD